MSALEEAIAVVDWRRAVHDLYATVRAARTPREAHDAWVAARTALFDSHPASARRGSQRLQHAPYDPAYRFELPLLETGPSDWTVATGTDG